PGPAGRYEFVRALSGGEPLPPAPPSRLREAGTQEFIHSLTAILGGICGAGFLVEDVFEPDHREPAAQPGSFAHRAAFVPPYLRVLARRTTGGGGVPVAPRLLVE
ncbi:MAG: hypothetical protein ACKOTB_00535, partial [Planctomycetia bacterium]